MRFTDEQVRRRAAEMGLADDDGNVPQSVRNRVVASLVEPSEPVVDEPLTVRIEIYYQGKIIGASSQQVALPKGD